MSKSYTIKTGAAALSVDEHYFRKLIREGRIPTTKVPVGKTRTWRHEVSEEDLEAWKARQTTRTSRDDGRNKYTLYATPAEIATIQAMLAEANLEVPLDRANPPKTEADEAEAEVEPEEAAE